MPEESQPLDSQTVTRSEEPAEQPIGGNPPDVADVHPDGASAMSEKSEGASGAGSREDAEQAHVGPGSSDPGESPDEFFPTGSAVDDESSDDISQQKMLEELAKMETLDAANVPANAQHADLRAGLLGDSHPCSTDGVAEVRPADFQQLKAGAGGHDIHNLDLLMDVTLPISIELGRTSMNIQEILNLGPGSIVELNKLAGEPVDLLVNNKIVARGEVVVLDENFGIRVTSLVSPEERLRSLGE